MGNFSSVDSKRKQMEILEVKYNIWIKDLLDRFNSNLDSVKQKLDNSYS